MNSKSVRLSISIPEDDYSTLQAIADENQVSLSWMIRKTVKEFLEGNEKKPLLSQRKYAGNK